MSKSAAKRFARILVGTDGSSSSQQACVVAAKLAKVFDSEVTVLSAIPSISATVVPLEGEYYSKVVNKADDNIEKAASVFEKAGVPVTKKEVPQGRSSPVETIVEYAEKERSDLIVVGTRGMGGFKRAALGSVSSAVSSHAPCPTLVVRPRQRGSTDATIRRVLVAIDGSQNAQRALELAIDLTERMEAELQIAHVVFVPALSWTIGFPGSTVPMGKMEEDAEKDGRQLIAKAVKFAKDSGIANPREEMVARLVSPTQGIVELADKGEADVIVVGTRGLGGFKKMLMGSVANSVLHYANCSVLVVK